MCVFSNGGKYYDYRFLDIIKIILIIINIAIMNDILEPMINSFIQNIQLFDHTAFRVSPSDAAIMDPHQWMALEAGYSALHVSGLSRGALMGSDTGVYAGIWQSDYSTVLLQRGVEGRSAIGAGVTGCNMLVGRVSFLLGLHGLCVAMDTACSSSLSAFQVGADALRRQDCDNALVMGINIMCDRLTSQIWISAHMTSPTGKSYSFDRRADGYARGEACSSLAIRREEGACSDGFLSEAGAVRQDGKSARGQEDKRIRG